tara:strand:+ start:210 stop:422 length:213 start_codon:yes stop_codon:yes gene_type:complete
MDKDIKKYLDELMEEMSKEAKEVRKDYENNPSPTEFSGSIHRVLEDSPMLKTRKERLITFKSNKNVDKKK